MIIVLFSQNVILDSLVKRFENKKNEEIMFLTTHKLFENEIDFLCKTFQHSTFRIFADFISDKEGADCDHISNAEGINTLDEYIENVNYNKNVLILNKIKETYKDFTGYVCCSDLGINADVWVTSGFEKVVCERYYVQDDRVTIKDRIKQISVIDRVNKMVIPFKLYHRIKGYVFEGEYKGKKYVFLGNLNRIGYRMNIEWNKSDSEAKKLINHKISPEKTYLTTIHELPKAIMMGIDKHNDVELRIIQDGYLPPNDPCEYLYYYPQRAKYYAWDSLGTKIFRKFNLEVDIMPFRKKIYLPHIQFHKRIKKILIATSGPGDWTAIKNRSDEDFLVEAFVKMAKTHPTIEFVIRCHPTWVRPFCNGVNSINRCIEYIKNTNLNNITVSSNIPMDKGENCFSRSSLDEDLKDTDFVFGEHSISMIDAVMKGIPFASVNLTNRRNLFAGITDLGFPHCESIEDIEHMIDLYGSSSFQKLFNEAIDTYNNMTDYENVEE